MRFFSSLLLLTVSAFAQDWNSVFQDTGAPGLIVVIVHRGKTTIQGFGQSARGSNTKPAANSLLRIGSLSKIMAAEVLSSLVLENKLNLADPLSRFAPRPIPIASNISLLQLATHTSGLPRNAQTRDRWRWLGNLATATADPGKREALYSNVAFDVLADALSQATSQPYPELLRQRLTNPLAMQDTTASPSPAQCQRLLGGTEQDPTTPCADMTATAGSGGMYSTAEDMGRWIRHLLSGAAQPKLAQQIYLKRQDLTRVEGLDHAGEASGLGLGWVQLAAQSKHPELLQKTGGGGGFMSYIAIAPTRKIGIFVAMTRVDLDASKRLVASVNQAIGLLSKK